MQDALSKSDEFWKQLIQHHVLDLDQVESYRRAERDAPWIPFGRILIRQGILTVRQVMGLVAIQATEPHVRIGDLAVREGHCTPEDVARCLDLQSRASPGPIEMLLRDGDVSDDKLVNALVGYIHHLEGRVESLTAEGVLEASAAP